MNFLEADTLLKVAIIFLFGLGLFCMLSGRNLIKIIIGIEILAKAVQLSLITAGYMRGNTAIGQTLMITAIVIDAVVVAVALSLAINIHKHHKSLSVESIRRLRW
ncbi:MAG: NADH-quinone oxidoreductase subunit K [Thermoplasmata archaeon]